MSQTNQARITEMKLAELSRQRERLNQEYQELTEAVARKTTPLEKLQTLYEGLKNMMFASQHLHPDVSNLDLLFAGESLVNDEMTADWLERLQDELQFGQRRTEFVYIFGALLEQWVSGQRAESVDDEATLRRNLLDLYREAPVDTTIPPLLEDALSVYEDVRETGKTTEDSIKDRIELHTDWHIYTNILQRIADDIYRPSRLRREASQFAENSLWAKELTDVVNILFSEFDDWDWPEDGVSVQLSWTRNKWRLFLEEDLFTAAFLERAGEYVYIMHSLSARGYKLNQVQKLAHQLATDSNGRNTLKRKLFSEKAHLELGPDTHLLTPDLPNNIHDEKNLIKYQSLFRLRASQSNEIKRGSLLTGGYNDRMYGPGIGQIASLVNAELQLHRRLYPEKPFIAIRIDIKDFYPTVPHHIVLEALRRLGLYDVFFEKYLQVRIQNDDEVFQAARGMPNDHLLSHLLGEVFMTLFDITVQRAASVQVIRLVDDITLLAISEDEAIKAWEAATAFCDAAGIEMNVSKTGAIAVNGNKPAALPDNHATWMLLRLDEDGNWHVDETRFEAHLAQTRDMFSRASSIVQKVQVYNENLSYLLKATGVSARLDTSHRQSVEKAVARFHNQFSEDDDSVVDVLRHHIRVDFETDIDMPEAWFYMPLTAGGPGLRQPLIEASERARTFYKLDAPEWPETQSKIVKSGFSDAYNQFYKWFHSSVDLASPEQTTVMESLVKDFIERGSTISAGNQQSLSAYWRWVLYLYGPVILDMFGTFRYLMTELVPVQLIVDKRLGDA